MADMVHLGLRLAQEVGELVELDAATLGEETPRTNKAGNDGCRGQNGVASDKAWVSWMEIEKTLNAFVVYLVQYGLFT